MGFLEAAKVYEANSLNLSPRTFGRKKVGKDRSWSGYDKVVGPDKDDRQVPYVGEIATGFVVDEQFGLTNLQEDGVMAPGEDVFKQSKDSLKVRSALSRWAQQRDYPGFSWKGVLDLCQAVVGVAEQVSVEAPKGGGWYRYPSSTKTDTMDGKDWRMVLPQFSPPVIINCHSCINEDVWTLSTTVFSSSEVKKDRLRSIQGDDRGVELALETAKILETQGYNYPEAKKAFKDLLGE